MSNVSESPKLRILCVDDEPYLLAALQRVLRGRFSIVAALGATSALDLLAREAPFDAVVSDFAMPGIDGIALLSQVASSYPDAARILLSGHGDDVLRKRNPPGELIDHCVQKPFPPLELADLITSTVAKRRARGATSGEPVFS